MKKIKLIFIYFYFLNIMPIYSIEIATQNINANLGEVLEIEKVMISEKEFEKNSFIPEIKINSTDKVNSNKYVMSLTPIKVKIKTNVKSPVIVYADFKELTHSIKKNSFKEENLSIYPTNRVINTPYNHIVSEEFTPYIVITPEIIEGIYNGTLTFTLSIL